jgi:MFS family permease
MTQPSFARNVAVLATCQALFFMANTVVISTSALVGLQYAPNPSLSTLALGSQFLGTMLATLPASFLMQRFGRGTGLLVGAAFGIAAGLLGWVAIVRGDFWLFCVAGLVYGTFGAFGQYIRFAAADAADAASGRADPALRARAIGWVMAGGTVAAVLGPELANRTRELFAPVMFAGCFAAIACLAAAGLAVASLLRLPVPPRGSAGGGRPIAEIARQPAAIVAFAAALVAYVTMNLLMTATPLAMIACGHGFADSAFVIQWHVLGMFAPSFVTGHLIARLGVGRVMGAGLVLLLACVAIDLAGVSVAHFAAALLLLGVGWNFLFVGATTLLTTCHTQAEKAKVQGLNDFLIFTTVGVSATLSGVLHELVGWQAMNLLVLPALGAVALLLVKATTGQAPRPAAVG